MRRTYAIALAAAALGSSLVLISCGGGEHGRTIELTASSSADRDIDLDPTDLSLGDHFVATEDVFRDGEKVGSDHAVCTITRIEPRTGPPATLMLQCVATLVLPEGQLTAQGMRKANLAARQPPRFTLAVTGGTDAYEDARGSVRIVDVNETDSRLTVELTG